MQKSLVRKGLVVIIMFFLTTNVVGIINRDIENLVNEESLNQSLLVSHPIYGTATWEDGGWAVNASVVCTSSEGTLPTSVVLSSGSWLVDCGKIDPGWPDGTDFIVYINGTGTHVGWSGSASGTVSGYYNDMGNIIVVAENNPPYIPSNPYPEDGATDVSIDADLSWVGGDPDTGDMVTYDVYFGTSSPPPQVTAGQSGTIYDPGVMSYDQMYYWKIVSWDDHGASTAGPVWSFTTEEEPFYEPDLDCSGTLSWTDVGPGDTVEGSFNVENIGDPLSLLDWEIESYPDWGTWSFDPESGTDLEEGDTVAIDVEVVAPDIEEETFTGEVVLVNSENPDDICTIDVSLATPVSQFQSNQQILRFMQSLLECFPILRHLMGL